MRYSLQLEKKSNNDDNDDVELATFFTKKDIYHLKKENRLLRN